MPAGETKPTINKIGTSTNHHLDSLITFYPLIAASCSERTPL
jgi:hypothetical protein